MAVIYLKHFLHGTKVAISEQEAQYDEKHGWQRYIPVENINDVEKQAPVNIMEATRKRKMI